MQEVAELKLCCPLPPAWVAEEQGSPPKTRYISTLFGVVLDEHPLDPYFRGRQDARGGLHRLLGHLQITSTAMVLKF